MKVSGYNYINLTLFGLLLATSCIVAPNLYSGVFNAKIIWLLFLTCLIAFLLLLFKLVLKGLWLVFFLLINSGCFSQMMRNANESQKIFEHQEDFLNKPLKNLLKEIRPKIRRVMATPSHSSYSNRGYFIFNFVDSKQNDSLRRLKKIPVTIVVYVKEYFDWDFDKRLKGKETIWTKEDAEKYGNLTIVGFRVYGDAVVNQPD